MAKYISKITMRFVFTRLLKNYAIFFYFKTRISQNRGVGKFLSSLCNQFKPKPADTSLLYNLFYTVGWPRSNSRLDVTKIDNGIFQKEKVSKIKKYRSNNVPSGLLYSTGFISDIQMQQTVIY